MAALSAHAVLLRTQDVRCDILVPEANPYTLVVDSYVPEVAGAVDRVVSAPSSRSQS
jgi:hypothetical protein